MKRISWKEFKAKRKKIEGIYRRELETLEARVAKMKLRAEKAYWAGRMSQPAYMETYRNIDAMYDEEKRALFDRYMVVNEDCHC